MQSNFSSALPCYDQEHFKCPHCGCFSAMQYKSIYFEDDPKYIIDGNKRKENKISVARCIKCGGKIVWTTSGYVYPDFIPEPANEEMPVTVKHLYNEAGLVFRKSPRAACALLRLAVDLLCRELGEKGKTIDDNIGVLAQKGLDMDIIKSMDVLRIVGNNAVHPGMIDLNIDNEYVAMQLMHLLNIIVQRLIADKAFVNTMFSKLPQDVQKRTNERNHK